MKAQCAAVLLATAWLLFVRGFLVKNTNSDISPVESTQLARKQTTIILSSKEAIYVTQVSEFGFVVKK